MCAQRSSDCNYFCIPLSKGINFPAHSFTCPGDWDTATTPSVHYCTQGVLGRKYSWMNICLAETTIFSLWHPQLKDPGQ